MGNIAPVLLSCDSTIDEISAYIKGLNMKSYSQKELYGIFANLTALVIDSYNFTYGANLLARNITKEFAITLNNYLEANEHHDPRCDSSYAFVSYYLLSYYYREYEEMAKLRKLISRYDDVYQQYALTHQIRGRLLRREKNRKQEAIECDRYAMKILKEKHIDNIGVGVTFASTVSLALENNEILCNDDDIKEAINYVKKAICINPSYGKYNYLLAKLLMFDLLKNENKYSYEDCINIILETKELLRKAIELEDTQTVAYASQVIEFKSYMRQADWILSEIRIIKDAKKRASETEKNVEDKFEEAKKRVDELLASAKNEISEKLQENQKKVDEQLGQMQNKYMEILALFVSVVSIIMVVVSMLSNKFSTIQMIMALVVMNACVLAVYSTFLILLKTFEKKYIITLAICLLIVLGMFKLIA